ncbi:MAG TPA: hypothetical protein DD723_01715 [Candidatus Omnitrophica bacterium]|nr:MAG: hypothetical protein A2Z81_04370 [Omnitrophica WOR_2 bacterium GWA2_45_18]HBR14248.1 hypothetical protein [Candidatus Omnitrophota bacterium]
MEKKCFIVGKICLFLSILIGGTRVSFADTHNEMGEFLTDLGESYYNQGDTQEAIHEFSKALLVDPSNEKAKRYLKELGLDQGLYKGIKTRSSQVAELADQVKGYKQQVTDLEKQRLEIEEQSRQFKEEKDSFIKQNQTKLAKAQELQANVRQMEESHKRHLAERDTQIKQMEKYYQDKSRDYQQTLEQQKSQFTTQLSVQSSALEVKEEDIKVVKGKLDALIGRGLGREDQAAVLTQKVHQLKKEAQREEKRRDNMFQAVDEYLYLRNDVLNDLKNQVVYGELDLVKEEQRRWVRLDDLIELNDSVGQHRYWLNERDAWIEEKNKSLNSLTGRLADIQTELKKKNALIQEQEKHLLDLKKELQNARSQLKNLQGGSQ